MQYWSWSGDFVSSLHNTKRFCPTFWFIISPCFRGLVYCGRFNGSLFFSYIRVLVQLSHTKRVRRSLAPRHPAACFSLRNSSKYVFLLSMCVFQNFIPVSPLSCLTACCGVLVCDVFRMLFLSVCLLDSPMTLVFCTR